MTNFISKPLVNSIASLCFLVLLCSCWLTNAGEIPESYDLRNFNPDCFSILDQGNCGSCWAFSAVGSLSDRFCITANGTHTPILSPQYQVNCDTVNSACNGGMTLAAYKFMQSNGVDTLECTSYVSGSSGKANKCSNTCDSAENQFNLYNGISAYSLVGKNINATMLNMQTDLMEFGSVSVSFIVYTDFVPFFAKNPTGVYRRDKSSSARGGHAVKLVGWGVDENDTPFWLIANSWGSSFGDKGYFRIVRGEDDSNIESRAVTAGLPKVSARFSGKIPSYASPVTLTEKSPLDGAFEKIEITEEIGQMLDIVVESQGINKQRAIGIMAAYSQVTNGINYKLEVAMNKGKTNEVKMVTVLLNKDFKDNLKIVNIY